ncbi:uncharacterized protein LOC127467156 [Manacus candei]|uniref:uncharacterized protein LOC127467156 n=1 Tax=Manacus candei TaxID=415023 RepID=UPI002226DA2C|nr:uncharacterized protein LOC127467156 [Manacus candei]
MGTLPVRGDVDSLTGPKPTHNEEMDTVWSPGAVLVDKWTQCTPDRDELKQPGKKMGPNRSRGVAAQQGDERGDTQPFTRLLKVPEVHPIRGQAKGARDSQYEAVHQHKPPYLSCLAATVCPQCGRSWEQLKREEPSRYPGRWQHIVQVWSEPATRGPASVPLTPSTLRMTGTSEPAQVPLLCIKDGFTSPVLERAEQFRSVSRPLSPPCLCPSSLNCVTWCVSSQPPKGDSGSWGERRHRFSRNFRRPGRDRPSDHRWKLLRATGSPCPMTSGLHRVASYMFI